jgi:hyperosmotically inducible protein
MKQKLLGIAITGMLATAGFAATTTTVPQTDAEIANKIAKEFRMYSRYTIWDNVNLRVNEGEVELLGEVSLPWKKKDLERLAERVPGVTSVTNNLRVLPTSFYDDQLRVRIARAIYRHPVLSRYAIQPVPPIHIIVDNGTVRLEGVVNNEMEKTVAGMQAGTAGLSFGTVENNLRVENPSKKKNG